jgi:protein-S-isoprenylcysteine O-methyltransferase Ste14
MANSISEADVKKAKVRLFFSVMPLFVVLPAALFLPAGSIRYWQAWIYYVIVFIPFIFSQVYLWKCDPALLVRRMKTQEKEKIQRLIMQLLQGLALVGFVISSFDHRYQWSSVPVGVVITANIFVFLGYVLNFFVFKENTYASRTVKIEEEQKVISTGPYAVVRHPMYSASIVVCLFTPLALGSFWGVIPFAVIVLLIVCRLFLEEKMLQKDLPGYTEYCQKTKYHLVPFIW